MDNGARSPSKPDPRQRVAGPLFRVIAPLVRFVLRRGLGEPNVLLTVRGRVTGQPRSTPVAMWELGDRRFVQASFGGEVNWVRNIRASARRSSGVAAGRWRSTRPSSRQPRQAGSCTTRSPGSTVGVWPDSFSARPSGRRPPSSTATGSRSMTISRRTLPRLGAPRSSSSSRRSRRRPPARGPNDRGALWRLCSHGGGGRLRPCE